jgi:hypothetical protein
MRPKRKMPWQAPMKLPQGRLTIPMRGAPGGPPAPFEDNPETYLVREIDLASRGPNPNSMLLPGPDGTPQGTADIGAIGISGQGVYIADCPLGWTGKLVLGPQEFSIAPGMKIPARYTSLRLKDVPPLTGPIGDVLSDSPLRIIAGPGALNYSEPGWRFHHWKRATLGEINATVNPGGQSALSNSMHVLGYDYWAIIVQLTSVSSLIVGVQVNWKNVIDADSSYTQNLSDPYVSDDVIKGPILQGGPWITSGGSLSPGYGFNQLNMGTTPTPSNRMPLRPFAEGNLIKAVTFRLLNNGLDDLLVQQYYGLAAVRVD